MVSDLEIMMNGFLQISLYCAFAGFIIGSYLSYRDYKRQQRKYEKLGKLETISKK